MIYQEDMDPQLRSEFLTDIDREIDRLSSVVGDLLTLVHIDSHKLKLRREMMVFADPVRESVSRLTPLAQKRGQEIHMQIADSCEMFADPGKLAQVCLLYTSESRLHSNGIGIIISVFFLKDIGAAHQRAPRMAG